MRFRIKSSFLFFMGICIHYACAQTGPGNIWYFGQNAGLSFTSGVPVALTDGKVNTSEGSSVISGCDGKLLFYTDGVTVWTKNHTVMPNGTGLLGDWSSTESSIVVPDPGSTNLFYLFTTPRELGADGLRYSIVDMTLNGGLGDVTSTKNVFLLDNVSEKITAVKHSNNIDYWVIVQCTKFPATNGFYTFLVTTSGIVSGPISLVGVTVPSGTQAFGYLKASPDGKRLAQAMQDANGTFEIYDFDNTTGVVSNPIAFSNLLAPQYSLGYGLEFSPNSKILYVGNISANQILQLDLTQTTQAGIAASAVNISKGKPIIGALQLGPDGKMYVALNDVPYLGVINSPNTLGIGCNYDSAGIFLSGKRSQLGLPNFAASFFNNPSPPVDVIIGAYSNITCFGGNDGSATAIPSGGDGNYAYSWDNGSTTATITGLNAGSYIVTVTGGVTSGCLPSNAQKSDTIIITEPSQLVAVASTVKDASCSFSDGEVSVVVSGGTSAYTYSWSSVGGSNAIATGLTAGIYTVLVTDAVGCTSTATALVGNTNGPAPIITNVSVVKCYGDSTGGVLLTVSGGKTPYVYSWSNGQTTASLSDLKAGVYTVLVTDNNGCTTTLTTSVAEPAVLSFNSELITDAQCNKSNGSASVLISGGTSSYNYSWSNGQTQNSATGLLAGNYVVVVTDANACSISKTVSINNINGPSLTLQALDTIKCFGGSAQVFATVSGGATPYNYSWSNGQTINSAITTNTQSLTAGLYSLVVVDNNSCSISSSILVSEPALLNTGTPVVVDAVCGKSNGSISVTVNGGMSPYTYSWSGGGVTNQSTSSITGLSSGVYTLTVFDKNTCSTTSQINVNNTNGPQVVINNLIQPTCFGSGNGSATAVVSGGTSGYLYSWSSGATTATVTGLTVSDYSVTVTDAKGCVVMQTISITEPTQINLTTASATNATCGNSDGAASIIATGGVSGYTYSWSIGSTLSSISGVTAGIYSLQVTDANGCTATVVVSILNTNGPSISTLSNTSVSCNGGSNGAAAVSASGGTSAYAFSWSDGQTGAAATGLIAGVYTVTVTDATNCKQTQTITISEPGMQVLSLVTAPACGISNGFASASVSGGSSPYSYIWSNNRTTQVNSLITSGTYTCTVIDKKGCTVSKSITVVAHALPTTTATDDTTIFIGSSIQLSATGGNSYNWSPAFGLSCVSCQNPVASPEQSTTYYVIVKDSNGCQQIDSVDVQVKVPPCSENDIYIPTAFSPDQNGTNDLLFVRGVSLAKFYLAIYNRWGEKVFESTNQRTGWDGVFGGQQLNSGVFVYYLKATCYSGVEFIKKGNITILR